MATRIMGIPELIREEVDGLLVAPSSAEELAAALVRLMENPALRRRIGEAGRVRVQEKYNIACNGAILRKLFLHQTGC